MQENTTKEKTRVYIHATNANQTQDPFVLKTENFSHSRQNASRTKLVIRQILLTFKQTTSLLYRTGGTRWRSWLGHRATSWKVAGSIPDCVTGIFHWHNPSSRIVALGSTQPLTEMSTRNTSWGVKVAGAYDWKPYHLYVPTVIKSGSFNLLELSGPIQGLLYLYLYRIGK
jgi:hypothetical protein